MQDEKILSSLLMPWEYGKQLQSSGSEARGGRVLTRPPLPQAAALLKQAIGTLMYQR